MVVKTNHFPEIIQDNDATFMNMLIGWIESIDELSSLEITKHPKHYHWRIAPSLPEYYPSLLEEILRFSNMYHIHLDLSKSIKSSGGSIDFNIKFEE